MSDAAGGNEGGGGNKSAGKGKKRKQYQAGGTNKKSRHGAAVDLNKGIAGYLVTCDQGKEQQCQREVIAWLTHYADTLYPTSTETAVADEAEVKAEERQSVGSALAAELAELKQQQRQPRSSKARFTSLDTGVRGIVFIHSRDSAVDHIQLLYTMLTDLTHTRQLHTRYTIRMHPLHRTCFSRPDDLYDIAQPLLASLLPALPTLPTPHADSPTQPPSARHRTFSIQLNKRGNHSLFDRNEVIGKLASLWQPGWTVDLEQPALVCLVEVCGRMAGIGLVERWQEFQKFNVRAMGEAVYRDAQGGGKSEVDRTEKAASDQSAKEEPSDENEVKETEL